MGCLYGCSNLVSYINLIKFSFVTRVKGVNKIDEDNSKSFAAKIFVFANNKAPVIE